MLAHAPFQAVLLFVGGGCRVAKWYGSAPKWLHDSAESPQVIRAVFTTSNLSNCRLLLWPNFALGNQLGKFAKRLPCCCDTAFQIRRMSYHSRTEATTSLV